MNAAELRQKDCFEKNGVLVIVSLLASKEKLRLYQYTNLEKHPKT